MKKHLIKTLILAILLIPATDSIAQIKWGLGAEVMYTFPPKSLGFGVRGEIFIIDKKLSAVPQVSYSPGILSAEVKDFNAGAAVHYAPFNFAVVSPYLIGAGGFNKRTYLEIPETAEAPLVAEEKFSTWSGELGIGLRMETCLRPFAELRYNFKWKEPNLHVGFMYIFNCKEEKLCPAYRESW